MKRQLGNGLILQDLSEDFARDKDRLPEFYYYGFESDDNIDENWLVAWVRDLINTHPLMSPEDFLYVVDPAADDRIVSGNLLIAQTWRYAGIEIPVGRPEIIATLPEYRRKGLVRETFKEIHARSEAVGHILQVITGIPNYYRQFGYAMAVPFGTRGYLPVSQIPDLNEGEVQQFTLRTATTNDIPLIMAVDAYNARSPLLSVVRDETMWHYDVSGTRTSSKELAFFVIENISYDVVGYVAMGPTFTPDVASVRYVQLNEKANYIEIYADLLREIKRIGQKPNENLDRIDFWVALHPTLTRMLSRHNGAFFRDDSRIYTYYMRVPDLPRFLMHISPVLEARLVGSAAQGYSGTLVIDMYQKECLLIEFVSGKLKGVGYGEKPRNAKATLNIHWDLFLHLLFGYQDFDEVAAYRADVYASLPMIALLDILFPKQYSSLLPIA